MSFLDNLENNLKALERQEERDPEKVRRDREERELEREAALKRAPFVEALKTSAFTSELLTQCRLVGREARVLVRFAWIGDNLRLDAGPKRLELSPEADGVVGVYSVDGAETARAKVDLEAGDPVTVARAWLVVGQFENPSS
ncbi:MAG: hypothetical protein WDO18_07470 [Acidobacteriota bacterium]